MCTIVYTYFMIHIMPVTEARRNLLKLVDQVDEKYTRVDLTKNGRIKATLVSPEYLDALEESIYTLQHSMDDIREAEKEINEGNYVTLEKYLSSYYASRKSTLAKKGKKGNK